MQIKTDRRKFIGAAAALCAGTAIAGAATAAPLVAATSSENAAARTTAGNALTGVPPSDNAKRPPLAHHVFFTLKNPQSKEDRDKLVEGVKTLAGIGTIRELRVGILADTEKRDVVDTSWQVSELCLGAGA